MSVLVLPDFFPLGADYMVFDCPVAASRFAREAIRRGLAERVWFGSDSLRGDYVATGSGGAVFVPASAPVEERDALVSRARSLRRSVDAAARADANRLRMRWVANARVLPKSVEKALQRGVVRFWGRGAAALAG